MSEPQQKKEPLTSLTFKILRWLITALACMPMIVIAIAIAKGQETLDVGTIGALFLLAGLPILVYHLFRWLALAALVFIPFLND